MSGLFSPLLVGSFITGLCLLRDFWSVNLDETDQFISSDVYKHVLRIFFSSEHCTGHYVYNHDI